MIRMIRLRKQCPEIGWGEWRLVPVRAPSVLALLYRWKGNAVLCLHNFDEQAREVGFRLEEDGGDRLTNLLELDDSVADADGRHRVALGAYGYRWYRLGTGSSAFRSRAE
jgi:maltose alpha-D-glucosyltransferase/alpha-amylase